MRDCGSVAMSATKVRSTFKGPTGAHPIPRYDETVGTWKRTLTARACTLEVPLFTALDAAGAAALQHGAERFAAFLGLPVTLEILR